MLFAMAVLACSRPTPAPGAVVVVMDTLRADYGGSDRLPRFPADQCRAYTRAHSAAPYTSASTAALVSGRLPAGAEKRRPVDAAGAWPEDAWPTAVLTDQPVLWSMRGEGDGWAAGMRGYMPGSEALVEEGVAWLESPPTEPWALYWHGLGAHAPYAGAMPDHRVIPGCDAMTAPDRAVCEAQKSDEAWPDGLDEWMTWQYRAAAERSQRGAESLLRAAPADSLFIFTSDHGEALGEYGLWGHAHSLHDAEIHVPLIVCGPGVIPGTDDTPVGPLCIAETVTGRGPCDLRTGEGLRAGEAGMLVEGEWVVRDVAGEWAELAHGGPAG